MSAEAAKPFELSPEHFLTHNMLIDSAVKAAIKNINHVDVIGKKGVPDIQEVAIIGAKVVPIAVALNDAFDFEAIAKELAQSKYVKNKEVAQHVIIELGKLIEEAGALMPHTA